MAPIGLNYTEPMQEIFDGLHTQQQFIEHPAEISHLKNGAGHGYTLTFQWNPKWANPTDGKQTGQFTVVLTVEDFRGHKTSRQWHCQKGDTLHYNWAILGREGRAQQAHFFGEFLSPDGKSFSVSDSTLIATPAGVPTPPNPNHDGQ